jgi:hypothetical protein
MTEHIPLLLCLPAGLAAAAILLKFVLLCQQAREEEFAARKKVMAVAKTNVTEKTSERLSLSDL